MNGSASPQLLMSTKRGRSELEGSGSPTPDDAKREKRTPIAQDGEEADIGGKQDTLEPSSSVCDEAAAPSTSTERTGTGNDVPGACSGADSFNADADPASAANPASEEKAPQSAAGAHATQVTAAEVNGQQASPQQQASSPKQQLLPPKQQAWVIQILIYAHDTRMAVKED